MVQSEGSLCPQPASAGSPDATGQHQILTQKASRWFKSPRPYFFTLPGQTPAWPPRIRAPVPQSLCSPLGQVVLRYLPAAPRRGAGETEARTSVGLGM